MSLLAALCFVWFFTALVWTVNALRRPVVPGQGLAPLWLPGMIVSELSPWFLIERALVAALFLLGGVLQNPVGVAGIVIFALGEVGLIVIVYRTFLGARGTGKSPSGFSLLKVLERLPEELEHRKAVEYADGLTLDLIRRPDVTAAPALVYLHPGSWMRGRPGRQARALFHRLALDGWVVLDIRYPLSPEATFPEHLIGVKRAIWWAKTKGAQMGIDPLRIAISGGSSGAHLASLAALTSHVRELQPGFDVADTSVVACVTFYGIYDLIVRNPTRYDWPFVARYVMKSTPPEATDLYRLGSPIDQVHPGAPPFLIVHGEFDSVVLPAESDHFAEALRRQGVEVEQFEVRYAQHGFDAFSSLRTRAVADLAAEWLEKHV